MSRQSSSSAQGLGILRRVPLFASLSNEELEAVASSTRQRIFGKGVIIFHEDSPGETMYIIESGKVRIFILSESGHEVSVRIFGCGEIFGELSVLDGLPRSAGAIAMEETHVLTLRRDDFQSLLMQYPQMALGIIATLSSRVRYTTDYAGTLAFLDVDGRVAKRLLELAAQNGVQTAKGTEIGVRLTQADLASLVGATRERINKVLGSFRDEGLVELDGHKVIILDPRGLQRKIVY